MLFQLDFPNKPFRQFPKTHYFYPVKPLLVSPGPVFSPSRRLYPPAWKPYGLEAEPEAIIPTFPPGRRPYGPEANWGEAPKFHF